MEDFPVLPYEIHNYSSYAGNYIPENIVVNKPSDQASRWSSSNNNPPQFITLKLKRPSIVRYVTFGKYEKTHVCNLKRFKIFGGVDETNMVELLDSGLRNDNQSESFCLRYRLENNPFPISFVKVLPLHSWGPIFNYSIWYVELRGTDEPAVVSPHLHWFHAYREREAVRLCLKHFRQQNYSEAFESLQKRTRVELEHSVLTQLHGALVERGDFLGAEQVLEQAADDGLFSEFIGQHQSKPLWTPILPAPGADRPGMRGGHQMCFDSVNELIYLLGGWDGSQDLADFWCFDTRLGSWSLISANTAIEGGPSARSCHKMCLDCDTQQLFTLGRYVDSALRIPRNLKSDFYMYDIPSRKWTLITDDTSSMGGPSLIFDHQMAVDSLKRTVYVFGGKELACATTSSLDEPVSSVCSVSPMFSGLFSYHVPTNTWCQIRVDANCPSSGQIRSRVSHCMVFDSSSRLLYVFAGQRNKEYLSDFFTYCVDSDQISMLSDGRLCEPQGDVPATGTTQRACIDTKGGEIHVLSGLSKDKDKRDDNLRNSFWTYDIKNAKWSCVYMNRCDSDADVVNRSHSVEPCPRFAHQLVFDPNKKVFYLFGGNPGRKSSPKMRLDDFWQLKVCRPSADDLLRECKHRIRVQRYAEMASRNSVEAVSYLQTEVSAVVQHADTEQQRSFQLLTAELFEEGQSAQQVRSSRTQLFDKLSTFFPASMSQPRDSLVDRVRIQM